MRTQYRFRNTTSRYAFWSITVDLDNKRSVVHFGRIGTEGQTVTHRFLNRGEQHAHAERMIAQKESRGYRMVA